MTETRTLYPIPWCTKHDQSASETLWSVKELKQIPAGCDSVRVSNECYEDTKWCVVSMGGPDHKWWKDIE